MIVNIHGVLDSSSSRFTLKAFEPRLAIGRLGRITATAANISLLEGEALTYKGQMIGHRLKKIPRKLTLKCKLVLLDEGHAEISPITPHIGGTLKPSNSERS